MKGKWDHSTKPSKFVVIDNGKEIYRGGFNEGCKIIEEGKDSLLKQVILERDEAQAALTTIHRWIKRNHPDGFIDSMNYVQNLERISDNWYDRFVRIERERDEAREKIKRQAERIRELEGATNHAGGLYKQK